MELDGVDAYKYPPLHYRLEVGDLNSLPSNPKPDDAALYFPYTIRCHRGVDGRRVQKRLTTDGFTSAYKPVEHDGYGYVINPVKCLDGKAKTDYDWLALKDVTEAVCDFDGAASAEGCPPSRRRAACRDARPRDRCVIGASNASPGSSVDESGLAALFFRS